MSFRVAFGKQIYIERTKLGITQQKISDKTGIGISVIDKIERGNYPQLTKQMYVLLRRSFDHSFKVEVKNI